MKKIIGIAAASAFAIAAISAPVAAAPDKGIDFNEPWCFGQVHKALNQPGDVMVDTGDDFGVLTISSVADAVTTYGGPLKNAVARGICDETYEIVS